MSMIHSAHPCKSYNRLYKILQYSVKVELNDMIFQIYLLDS